MGIAACGGGATATATATMRVAYPPIALERAEADREHTVVSRADLEVVGGTLCVRALSLGGRRLTAAPGDPFVGALRCDSVPTAR
jgi:hypothetical protein